MLTGRVDSAETAITQNASEINKRLTKTQVNQAILADKKIKDTRGDNQSPQWYLTNYPRQTVEEFKTSTVIGLNGESAYAILTTNVQWNDSSGGKVKQTAKTDRATFERYGAGTTWEAWTKIANAGDLANYTTKTEFQTVLETTSLYERTIGAVGTAGSILDNISKVTQTAAGLVQEVSGTNGLKTQVGQLKDSWAVKLSGPDGLKTAINASTDGIRLLGKNIRLDGNTLIDNGVIKSAMIANGQIGTAHIGTIDAGIAKIVNLDVRTLTGFDAAFIKGKFDNVIADLIKGKNIFASNGNMNIDLQNGMITMRNSGKFIVEGGYAEFARQEGLVKASLAFHDNASTKNGIKLSVDDGLGKSTSIKSIWLNERDCYISDFDEISLHTASGNGIRITKDALEFTVGGNNYIWGKTTFNKISKL
ncbi:hypothetical protein HO498_01505 [Streptococcus suis]|nr:hypothetical protein [Streptococcus suis]